MLNLFNKKVINTKNDVLNLLEKLFHLNDLNNFFIQQEGYLERMGDGISEATLDKNSDLRDFYYNIYGLDNNSIHLFKEIILKIKPFLISSNRESLGSCENMLKLIYSELKNYINKNFRGQYRSRVSSIFESCLNNGYDYYLFNRDYHNSLEFLIAKKIVMFDDIYDIFKNFSELCSCNNNIKSAIEKVNGIQESISRDVNKLLSKKYASFMLANNGAHIFNNLISFDPGLEVIEVINTGKKIENIRLRKAQVEDEKINMIGIFEDFESVFPCFLYSHENSRSMSNLIFGAKLISEKKESVLSKTQHLNIDIKDESWSFYYRDVDNDTFFKYKHDVVIFSEKRNAVFYCECLIDNPEDIYQLKFNMNRHNVLSFIKSKKEKIYLNR